MITVKDIVASATRFISSKYKWMARRQKDQEDSKMDKEKIQMVLAEHYKD